MSSVVEIGYLSETDREYATGLRKVKTLKELQRYCAFYAPVAPDAIEKVATMKPDDFDRFARDMKMSSRAAGKRAQQIVEDWGAILMPSVMLQVSLTAGRLHVVFGTAYIRMKELGRI